MVNIYFVKYELEQTILAKDEEEVKLKIKKEFPRAIFKIIIEKQKNIKVV